jgi:hypothetical protein
VASLNRLRHWFYARTHGYFWLPCPICGRKFGGHEEPKGTLMKDWGSGQSTCPQCFDEAKKRSEVVFDRLGDAGVPYQQIGG